MRDNSKETLDEMIEHFEDVVKRLKAARAAMLENLHATGSQLDVLQHLDHKMRDTVEMN